MGKALQITKKPFEGLKDEEFRMIFAMIGAVKTHLDDLESEYYDMASEIEVFMWTIKESKPPVTANEFYFNIYNRMYKHLKYMETITPRLFGVLNDMYNRGFMKDEVYGIFNDLHDDLCECLERAWRIVDKLPRPPMTPENKEKILDILMELNTVVDDIGGVLNDIRTNILEYLWLLSLDPPDSSNITELVKILGVGVGLLVLVGYILKKV